MKKIDGEETENESESESQLREQQTQIALDADAEAFSAIEALRETGASGSQIGIYYRAPGARAYGYAGTMNAEDFNLETIKEVYGGGDYKVQPKVKGKLGKAVHFTIDHRVKAKTDPLSGQNNNTDQTALIEAIRMLRDLKQPAPVPENGLNSGTILTLMMESSKQQMTMMAEVAKAIAGRPAEAPRPVVDVVGLITALSPLAIAVLNRPAGGSGGNLKEQVETLKSLKDVVENNSEEPGMLDKIMKVAGPLAGPLLGAMMNRGQPQIMSAPQTQVQTDPPQPAQLQQANEAGPVPIQQSPRLCDVIRPYLPILINSAVKGSDPEFVLDLIDEVADPRLVALVVDALKHDNWREMIFENHPLVTGQYKAWFDKLRDCALTSDDNEQPDIDYPGRNVNPGNGVNGSPGITAPVFAKPDSKPVG